MPEDHALDPEQFLRGDFPQPDADPEPPAESDPEPESRGISRAYHDDAPRSQPEPEPEPEPAPQPQSPPSDPRLDSLQQTVNTLLLQQSQRPQQYYPQQQPQPQPQQPQGWQPRDFLSAEDAHALLTTNDPAAYLNRTFNTVAQSVYEPMLQELQRRDAMLAQMNAQQQQRYVAEQQQQLAKQNVETFYAQHPEVQEFSELVPLEVDNLAREAQSNPVAFVNRTNAEVYDMLAERVMNRVTAIRGGEAPAQAPAPRRGIAQRTTLERGSGTRPGAPATPKDPDKKQLVEMTRHLQSARR